MTKKEKERNNFSSFANLFFGHEIDFEQPNPPLPDIVFNIEGKRTGCEITTIFRDNEPGVRPSFLKKNESIQDSICKSIEKWLTQNIPIFLQIHICYYNRLISDSRIVKLTGQIISLIESNISEIILEEHNHLMINSREVLPNELNYLSIYYSPSFNRTIVSRTGASCIPNLERERIITNIRHKEKKLEKYRELLDSYWLLLIIHNYIFSSDFDLRENEYNNIESIFDKILIYSKRDQKIVTIK